MNICLRCFRADCVCTLLLMQRTTQNKNTHCCNGSSQKRCNVNLLEGKVNHMENFQVVKAAVKLIVTICNEIQSWI